MSTGWLFLTESSESSIHFGLYTLDTSLFVFFQVFVTDMFSQVVGSLYSDTVNR